MHRAFGARGFTFLKRALLKTKIGIFFQTGTFSAKYFTCTMMLVAINANHRTDSFTFPFNPEVELDHIIIRAFLIKILSLQIMIRDDPGRICDKCHSVE